MRNLDTAAIGNGRLRVKVGIELVELLTDQWGSGCAALVPIVRARNSGNVQN